jgi:hypothetical protein
MFNFLENNVYKIIFILGSMNIYCAGILHGNFLLTIIFMLIGVYLCRYGIKNDGEK